MEHIDTYGYILDEIFFKIEEFSRIVIDYQANNGPGNEQPGNSFIVVSVNGHHDPKDFYKFMVFLCTGIVQKLSAHLQTLAPGEQPVFLDFAIRRFKKLREVAGRIPAPPGFVNIHGEIPKHAWVFNRECMDLAQETDNPRLMPEEVLLKASVFAYSWKNTVKESSWKLKAIHSFYENIPWQPVPAVTAAKPEKIEIKRTVPQLAAFLKLLHAIGVFGTISKTELCRISARFFRTEKQEDISARSLKNHLDSPSPEVMDFLKIECHKMVQEIMTALIALFLTGDWLLLASDLLDDVMDVVG